MRILSLEAENFKRLKAVEIHPTDDVVEIVGGNAAGKSSVLDAIWSVLGGADANPGMPIRKGESNAIATLDLGDLVITRRWSAKGSTITVSNPDGSRHVSPQKILDNLLTRIAFDPLAFSRLPSVKQAEYLRAIAGIDFRDLDEQEAALRNERTAKGRDVKHWTEHRKALGDVDGEIGTEEISTDALTKKLAEIETQRRLFSEANAKVGSLRRGIEQGREAIATKKARILMLEEEIRSWEAVITADEQRVVNTDEWLIANRPPSADLVKQTLADADEINAQVRRKRGIDKAAADLLRVKQEYDVLSERIDGVAAERAKRLGAAKMPLQGLGLDHDVVTLDGIPVDQLSSAQQIGLGLAIGAKVHPTLRVALIRDGSLLDVHGMRSIRAWAEANDFQIWIERVGGPESTAGVVIEDGQVVADRQKVPFEKSGRVLKGESAD